LNATKFLYLVLILLFVFSCSEDSTEDDRFYNALLIKSDTTFSNKYFDSYSSKKIAVSHISSLRYVDPQSTFLDLDTRLRKIQKARYGKQNLLSRSQFGFNFDINQLNFNDQVSIELFITFCQMNIDNLDKIRFELLQL